MPTKEEWDELEAKLDAHLAYRAKRAKEGPTPVAFCPVSEEGCTETPVCPWPCKKLKP